MPTEVGTLPFCFSIIPNFSKYPEMEEPEKGVSKAVRHGSEESHGRSGSNLQSPLQSDDTDSWSAFFENKKLILNEQRSGGFYGTNTENGTHLTKSTTNGSFCSGTSEMSSDGGQSVRCEDVGELDVDSTDEDPLQRYNGGGDSASELSPEYSSQDENDINSSSQSFDDEDNDDWWQHQSNSDSNLLPTNLWKASVGLQTSFRDKPIRLSGRTCLGIVVAERQLDSTDTDGEPGQLRLLKEYLHKKYFYFRAKHSLFKSIFRGLWTYGRS